MSVAAAPGTRIEEHKGCPLATVVVVEQERGEPQVAGSRSSTASHVGKGGLRAIFWVSFSHSRKNKVVALDLLHCFSLTKKKKK